jgi:hypothetical protein
MSKAFGAFQKLSHKNSGQKSVNQAAHEEEPLTNARDALSLVQHTSGDCLSMQRSLLQLQRTIGNHAVSQLVNQRSAETSVQRVIAMEASGLPVLSTYFDTAAYQVSVMVNADTYVRFKDKLAASHPMKTKTFQQAWAIKTMRPTILQFAQSEYSPENINFLLAVETYKESPSVDKAVQLYTDYIRAGAPTQVNLSAATRGEYDTANATFTAAPVTRARS